jgi:hypothetical protein
MDYVTNFCAIINQSVAGIRYENEENQVEVDDLVQEEAVRHGWLLRDALQFTQRLVHALEIRAASKKLIS